MFERTVDEDGTRHGIGEGFILTVFPDFADAEIFYRKGIKMGMDGEVNSTSTWLVGRLNGVYVYMIGDGKFIMTMQEINP